MLKRILLISVIVIVCMSLLLTAVYFILRSKPNVIVMIMSNDAKKFQYLLDKDPALINASDRWESTPLHWAARLEKPEIVKVLIDSGASVYARDIHGNTPMHCAAESWTPVTRPQWSRKYKTVSSGEIVTLLVQNGADVDVANKYGFTPLHEAARSGDIKVVEVLIKAGANVNSKCVRRSFTPLHAAAYSGKSRAVEVLIKNGADINAKSGVIGNTPFHLAAASGTKAVEVCRVFLDNGAMIDTKNNDQFSPLDIAKDLGTKELVELLQNSRLKKTTNTISF
jgi:ankyrin repeat protein